MIGLLEECGAADGKSIEEWIKSGYSKNLY